MGEFDCYELIIIGAGPAGLTASIYASCFHLKHIVLSSNFGGQMLLAPDILNYPGFNNISGKELTERMVAQAKMRGGEIMTQSVTKISNIKYKISRPEADQPLAENKEEKEFKVETQEGKTYHARAIILATGTERRKLGIPGEVEYTARGVHYCATCEKQDYEGKVSAVVGGGNSAVQAAVELSQAAKKVYIVYRGKELRGDPIWLEQIAKNTNIEVLYNTVVSEIIGDGEKVTSVKLSSYQAMKQLGSSMATSLSSSIAKILSVDKIFIEIGGVPGTALVIPLGVKMDTGGYITVDEKLATSVEGVFAAGDLVSYGLSIEQISSAVGLGARAAASAFAYLKKDKAPTLWGKSQIKR